MGHYTYSNTAASNTSVDGIGAQGSDSPDNIDNLVRALAASDAAFVRDLGGANTVGGTADAITVTLADPTAATSYFDGMMFSFRVASDNSSASVTINVDGIGTKPVKRFIFSVARESTLAVSDLVQGQTAVVIYRSAWDSGSGAFQLLNPYTDDKLFIGQSSSGGGDVEVHSAVSRIRMRQYSSSPTGSLIELAGSRNSTIGGNTVMQSGDQIGVIDFQGSDNSGFRSAARIYAVIDGAPGSSDMPGALVFGTTADGFASVTERLRIKSDGSWLLDGSAAVSNGQVVKQTSGKTQWGGISTFDTVKASTSGSEVDFTGIPSWVREIDVIFDGVSLSGTDDILIQLGDSGGVETTGYAANTVTNTPAVTNSTAGFIIRANGATNANSGIYSLKNITGNVWIGGGNFYLSSANATFNVGSKTLSATLDRIRIDTTGTNTFDAGQINICYR